MKEQILKVLSCLAPMGVLVFALDKPALGCIVFAIGFIAALELIRYKSK